MPSRANNVTAISHKKRSKPLPALLRSTGFLLPLTASPLRSSPVIRFKSSSPVIRMTPQHNPSKTPRTASFASASPFCALLPARNSPPSPAPSRKPFPISPSTSLLPSSVPAKPAFLPPATPTNSGLPSKTAPSARPPPSSPRKFFQTQNGHGTSAVSADSLLQLIFNSRDQSPSPVTSDYSHESLLLLRPRLRRHHPVCPVIHHQVAVVLSGVLNQSVRQVTHSVEPWAAGVHGFVHSLVAFGLDHLGAVLHALLHIRDQVGLTIDFQVRGFGIIRIARLLVLRRVSEVVHGRRDVYQHRLECPRIRIRLVVILVLRQILGNRDQFPPDFVPLLQHLRRRT